MEIPVIYTFNGHEAIEWIKFKIQEDIKLEQGIKSHCLKYNKNQQENVCNFFSLSLAGTLSIF